MKSTGPTAEHWIPHGGGLALLGLVASCAGPQPLDRAIRPQDERDYTAMMTDAAATPAEAFLRGRARELGVTFGEAQRRDLALSDSHNPFRARHDPVAVSRGAVIYEHQCIACHGKDADGRGRALPVPLESINFHRTGLRIDITMHGGAVEKWFKTIENGASVEADGADGNPITITMPGFKDRLAREQVWLVVTYLQSLNADIPRTAPSAPSDAGDDRGKQ